MQWIAVITQKISDKKLEIDIKYSEVNYCFKQTISYKILAIDTW